ncbi:MAG: hypothetical protein WA477_06345 [Candidatus Sulfotelmatobacter sp.]
MKWILSTFLLLLVVDLPNRPEPAIPYFTNVREVHIAEPARQNFFVVDEALWTHARPDLGDLRLYDANTPVQYALSEQSAGVSSEEVEAKILNLGTVSGHTEFDLDTAGLAEYDRIRLRLDAHNFVATAFVSGDSAPRKATEVKLPSSTLYDFTKEQLGSSSFLKLPPSSFPYLHIKLSPGITPQQVNGATIFNLHEQKASWTNAGSCASPEQKLRITIISCTFPEKVPVSRIAVQVAPNQVNFRRTVEIEDAKGVQVGAGEITRVRVNRAGTLVTNEELAINMSEGSGHITLSIDNGDNPPLAITSAQPLTLERRIYFDPQGKSVLKLYYGDENLPAPIYDYARFFHAETSPAEAQLGPDSHNSEYSGRPDQRPWSERHVVILWTAMLLVVLVLASLAIRGLRATPRP